MADTRMEPGQDADDYFLVLGSYGCRKPLEEIGQTTHDEGYVGTILQALPFEYERV